MSLAIRVQNVWIDVLLTARGLHKQRKEQTKHHYFLFLRVRES